MLRLVRNRKARPEEFRRLLESAVARLESMPSQERLRWLELLLYIHMLVYHEHAGPHCSGLQEVIEASVQTDEHRRLSLERHCTSRVSLRRRLIPCPEAWQLVERAHFTTPRNRGPCQGRMEEYAHV